MEIPKVVILLCCAYYGFASHDAHTHTIPVEHYETELHNLGEHVEIPETPVRVIKITKTVAIKVPVPYPVKVIQKVPYPVHINKPYPVPVPHIVRVPHAESPQKIPEHEPLGSRDDLLRHRVHQETYEVQEKHSHDAPNDGNSYEPENQSYQGGNSGYSKNFASFGDDHSSEGLPSNSYEAPSHNYYGNAGADDSDTFEAKSYDDAVQNYLQKANSLGNSDHGLQNYNYH